MSPKRRRKGCKAIAQRKLDECLDAFLRACDVCAGRNLEGPTASSSHRSIESNLRTQARGHGAPPRAPSHAPGSPPFASAETLPLSPTPPDTGGSGGPYDHTPMTGTNPPEAGSASLNPLTY